MTRTTILLVSVIFFASCNSREQTVDKNKLLGNDYRLFQDTPVWDLAKAVRDANTSEIKRLVQSQKMDVDYQESKFGSTLLMLSVLNEQYNSAKALLENGADPNKHDTYTGISALICSAGIQNQDDDNTKFLKLMLLHGGNPNDEETGDRGKGNSTRKTPLLEACADVIQDVTPIEKVKLLVDAGADINHKNEYGATPLKKALTDEHYDVILFFLQKGADFRAPLFKNLQGKEFDLIKSMRFDAFPLDSKKYQEKMKVVEFLKQKGMDYRKVSIPKKVVENAKRDYPNNWQEYLEKY